MTDNRNSCGSASSGCGTSGRDVVCIDTYRVLDSCRDRDCYEDVRVYLNGTGQEIIDKACSVRSKYAEIACAYVGVEEVPFNRGFYQLTVKYYIRLCFEACVGTGRGQEFEGVAVIEKKAILYGGEGNVSIFRSTESAGFCDGCDTTLHSTNMPVGVVEAVAPIVLSAKIVDASCQCGCCCCSCDEVPDCVADDIPGGLIDPDDGNRLYISIGIFSVIRIERPAQLLITATDYSVPDKECVTAEEDDPCKLFRSMAFPTNEFSGTTCAHHKEEGSSGRGGCGCK